MLKSFKTEINPTEEQKAKIRKTIGTCRYIYNFYLAHNKELYNKGEKFMSSNQFRVWLNNEYLPKHPECFWIKEAYSKAVTQAVNNGQAAFIRFFKHQSSFPRFKKKNRSDVKMYFVKNNPKDCRCQRHRINIPSLGWVRIKEKGYIPTTKDGYVIKSGHVSIKADRYYVSVLVELPDNKTADNSNEGIGIDLGLKDFAIVSNGKIYSYNSGLLYRAAKHDKEYYWSNPASAYTYVYVFDELSKKFYILKNQIDDPALGLVSDPYALDRVVEIKNQPSYEGQTIIYKYVSRAHVMSMATAQTGKINLISFEYIDFKKATEEEPAVNEDGHLLEMETLPLAGADANTKGVLVAENDWYFVVGNKVYTTPVLKPMLTDFVTLPDDIGKPVAVAVSAKETQLIIATYDAGSPKEYKGSFVIVDLMSREVTVHRNVMGKCVVAKGYDSNPWW